MSQHYRRTKFSCYFANFTMTSAFSLPPLLFTTFQEIYGISYTLLGTLIMVNFLTQLTIDLIFSFFGKHFNPHTALRVTPLLTGVGLITYALIPLFLPSYAYLGLIIGTIIFSVAAGLGEVLISPTIAAIPSDHPERDMAALHSIYGYGIVMVVLVSTLFLEIFGNENWMYLTLIFALLPIIASALLISSQLPPMNISHSQENKSASNRNTGIILCMLIIFFGSAAENSMTNWISGYIESALQIPKAVGDIFGLAMFAVFLALTRSAYAKFGKNIYRILLISMSSAVVCYLVASLSPIPIISMIACVLTGIATSMLWPGTLILMEEKIPGAGVVAYALMAAGGDFGASVAPQALGIIVDTVAASEWGLTLSQNLTISPEQLGMKIGMLVAAIFPLLGVFVLLYIKKYFNKTENLKTE